MAKVQDRIRELSLMPLEGEGGYFRFLHLFGDSAGCIYYLITPSDFSSLHMLDGDEVWFFLEGRKAEQITYSEGGSIKKRILDSKNRNCLVKKGDWQATRLIEGEYALFCTIMSPHYEDKLYHAPERRLLELCPELKEYTHL